MESIEETTDTGTSKNAAVIGRGLNMMKKAAQRVASDITGRKSEGDAWKPIVEFLKASRFGDSIKVAKLLESNPQLDVNTGRDMMGNSPLILAVKNDHVQVVESLLARVTFKAMREALLLSISMDHNHISEIIISHPRYQQHSSRTLEAKDSRERALSLETTLDVATSDTLFAAEITPLILAAQRNQFEIVKMLLAMGETIEEPHHPYCSCQVCVLAQASGDELKIAKTRLNVYKGLASDAYLSLGSSDPILKAFDLARTLRETAEIEKYFKADYKKLGRQLSDFTVKLLDKVRDGKELDTILNESKHTPFMEKDRMARLKLAIRYDEKLFVTHPSCQKKLTHLWYAGLRRIQKRDVTTQVLWSLGFAIVYPVLAVLYWIYPYGKIGSFMETPVVKFIGSAISLMVFVCLNTAVAFTEKPSEGFRLSDHDAMGPWFLWYNATATDPEIGNVFVRNDDFRVTTIFICIFVLGYFWQLIKSLFRERVYFFIENLYNIMDSVMLALYVVSFALRYHTVIEVRRAVDHFSDEESWKLLLQTNSEDSHIYWLNADRTSWDRWDAFFLAEATLALANMLCLMRTTYILAASELVGPLLISLKHMVKNVLVFMVLFVVVIVAFVVAFHSLYWYFDEDVRVEAEDPVQEATEAEGSYGKLLLIMRTVYFSLFGMTDSNSVEIGGQYDSLVTVTVGYALFGAYNWITVIVLLNMLIAMMARSYEFIEAEKDMEWKYDRSKLYLDYIKDGNTLCVPFNLVPTWWGVVHVAKYLARCCCGRRNKDADEDTKHHGYSNEGFEGPVPVTRDADKTRVDKTRTALGDRNSEQYKKVIGMVAKRFILHSTTKREEEGIGTEEDNASTMFSLLKRDLSNFRYDVVKGMARQDKERESMFMNLSQLDQKLQETRRQLEQVISSCNTTEKTLSDEIGPDVTESKDQLTEMGENVVTLKEDVNKHDDRIQHALHSMNTTVQIDLCQFQPIMESLQEIQARLQNLGRENVGATLSRTNAYGRMEYSTSEDLPESNNLSRRPFAVSVSRVVHSNSDS